MRSLGYKGKYRSCLWLNTEVLQHEKIERGQKREKDTGRGKKKNKVKSIKTMRVWVLDAT